MYLMLSILFFSTVATSVYTNEKFRQDKIIGAYPNQASAKKAYVPALISEYTVIKNV